MTKAAFEARQCATMRHTGDDINDAPRLLAQLYAPVLVRQKLGSGRRRILPALLAERLLSAGLEPDEAHSLFDQGTGSGTDVTVAHDSSLSARSRTACVRPGGKQR